MTKLEIEKYILNNEGLIRSNFTSHSAYLSFVMRNLHFFKIKATKFNGIINVYNHHKPIDQEITIYNNSQNANFFLVYVTKDSIEYIESSEGVNKANLQFVKGKLKLIGVDANIDLRIEY
jgi:hypothetical protein